MARKTKEEAEKTKSRIMDAALDVFYRQGLTRSTLNDIAAEAGVTRGAIYWHFKDKMDLLKKINESINGEVVFFLKRPGVEEMDRLSDIAGIISQFFVLLETNERFAKFYAIMSYKVEYTDELEALLTVEFRESKRFRGFLESTYEKLMAEGKVTREVSPRQAALAILSMIWGMVEMWILDRTAIGLSTEGVAILMRLVKGFETTPEM